MPENEIINNLLKHSVFRQDGFIHTDASDVTGNQDGGAALVKGRLKVIVNQDGATLVANLVSSGRVLLAGTPDDARIDLRGEAQTFSAETGKEINLPVGVYTAVFSKFGWQTQTQSFGVSSGQAIRLSYALPFTGGGTSGSANRLVSEVNGGWESNKTVLNQKSTELILYSTSSTGDFIPAQGVQCVEMDSTELTVRKSSYSSLTTHRFEISLLNTNSRTLHFTSSDSSFSEFTLYIIFDGTTTQSTTFLQSDARISYSIKEGFHVVIYGGRDGFTGLQVSGSGYIPLREGAYQYVVKRNSGEKVLEGTINSPGVLAY